ncbi:Metallo-hydrolase/oxidoreductase [Exidia glandulosa HHB12029]|uniref:Metallo-hydrolase/oxidoreductase n=1 Tax=Exidia glandulosa HHB12029 TaxID=1314781 RepID=A0A165L3U8_EXIGL|nr:Metallo-hydrolase/oxidoreductase [Exidia glandulosa HHB12029]
MTSLSSFDITFLGTASAQPSSTRNHSALALRLGGEVWLFDCGEATQHQVQRSKDVRMGRIRKIFITHTHGDHIFGLAPLMASAMNGAGGTVGDADDRVQTSEGAAPVEIYGPLGTRAYIRAALCFTHTLLEGRYVVHELRFPTDPLTDPAAALTPHACELVSHQRDILQAANGTWPDIFLSPLLSVSAAPIHHSVPCVGYVVSELPIPGKIEPSLYAPHINRNKVALVKSGIAKPMSLLAKLQAGETLTLPDGAVLEPPPRRPGRKVVILGDTYDPRPIASLAHGADVLIHEATNAYLPGVDLDTKESDTAETVQARAVGHGHSTPQMAGAFARDVGARMLVLNHFSARYPGDESEQSRRVMDAIRHLAVSAFESDEVICARDFMSISVPRRT